jgi:tRNA pseudouridine38-40 synthase
MRYLVRAYYDGIRYHGYQRQPNVTTIEGSIITMLKKTKHIQNVRKSNFKSASRTDKFVSAIGNTFAFDSEKEIILEQINAKGPNDKSIICWAYTEVEEGFSPKFSNWKKYWYLLPSEFVEKTVNLKVNDLKKFSAIFIGKHDFKLFCKRDHRSTIREIEELNIFERNSTIIFEFVAQSFLWEQVRRIVSYLLNFERLSEELQNTELLLTSDIQINELNLPPANPRNLLLVEHFYDKTQWIESEIAIKSIIEKLETKHLNLKRDLSINAILYDFFRKSS